jgi:hypothetical protein
MSHGANIFLGNRLYGQIYFCANIPSGEISFWANDFWANVVLANVFIGKSLFGQMSSRQMSFWVNVVWANVSGQLSLGKRRMCKRYEIHFAKFLTKV